MERPGMRAEGNPAMRPEEKLARRGGAIELLRAPAMVFEAAALARRALYDRGWLPRARLPVPVVSVGNITTGGTGKTPACAWVVARLQQRGFRPGLLSRGYGAGSGALNDEALLLERLCPGVPHVQDPDRARGGRRLLEAGHEHAVDAIVLDDGFQHRRLARDVDIVLVDATRPWGLAAHDGAAPVRALLPRGLLREPLSSLRRADAIVITRCEAVGEPDLIEIERTIQSHAPGRAIVRARTRARFWRDERGNDMKLAALEGRDVDVISALGNPAAFEASVRATGVRVHEHRVFKDHHRYTEADVRGLPAHGRELVTSAKDAVKLAPLGLQFMSLESEFVVDSGANVIDALLDALPRPEAGKAAL